MAGQASRLGFTLAEVLITLCIIGVVAAITMPSLVASHLEKSRVGLVLSTYSKLSEAVRRMMVDEGSEIQFWGNDSKERVGKFKELLPKYIEIIAKERNKDNSFFMKNGVKIYSITAGTQGAVSKCNLKSNYSNAHDPVDDPRGSYFGACGSLLIDINSDKKPNQEGIDIFGFNIVSDGITPMGHPSESVYNMVFDSSKVNKFVTAWVVYNKNMDYLHCPKKLGWDKASSCK